MANRAEPLPYVLDLQQLAELLGTTPLGIHCRRSRGGNLPPPFSVRPLRWRGQAVADWMERQEQALDPAPVGERVSRRRA